VYRSKWGDEKALAACSEGPCPDRLGRAYGNVDPDRPSQRVVIVVVIVIVAIERIARNAVMQAP
jgi:hypothetical protein